MIQQVKTTKWVNDSGRDLIVLEGDGTAKVIPATCSAKELDDLAEACTAAADALRLTAESTKVRIAE